MIYLKFDVYCIWENNRFTLIQLVPVRKQWTVRYDPSVHTDVKDLIDALIAGSDSQQLAAKLAGKRTLQQIMSFLESNLLLSGFELESHKANPFLRQLEVFDSWNRTVGVDPIAYQERLGASTVLLIGAGGVGCALAGLLVSIGVGRIIVADDDVVEVSNLARQSLYLQSDLGRKKVDALTEHLTKRGLSEIIGVSRRLTAANYDEILGDESVSLASGLAFPRTDATLNLLQHLTERGIPFLCVGEREVGPMLSSPTAIREFDEWMGSSFRLHSVWARQRTMRANLDTHPSFAPTIATVAGIAVDEMARKLSDYAGVRTTQGAYGVEAITGEVKFHRKSDAVAQHV